MALKRLGKQPLGSFRRRNERCVVVQALLHHLLTEYPVAIEVASTSKLGENLKVLLCGLDWLALLWTVFDQNQVANPRLDRLGNPAFFEGLK